MSRDLKDHPLRRILAPAAGTIILLLPKLYLDVVAGHVTGHVLPRAVHLGRYVFGSGAWLCGAWLMVRLLDLLFWDMIVAPRMRGGVPRLLKDLVAFLVFTFAIFGIMGGVFGLPLTGALASFGAIGVVIGFALRGIISDIFSGIAINLEQSFKIGDWIGLDSGETGEVVEVNWRTTTIRSLGDIVTVVPNSRISAAEFKNYSRPESHFRWFIEFHLDYDVPTERALRVLTAAARSQELPLANLHSDALVADIDELGVKYWVRFWAPRYTELNPLRSRVLAAVMRNLYQAGLSPVHSKHDVYTAPMPVRSLDEQEDTRPILERIDLFDALTPEETQRLADNVQRLKIEAGEAVVSEGEQGDSLFILVEGLLEVTRHKEAGVGDLHVGHVQAGDFFGEVSLLTGAPRSANVVTITDCIIYEIRKQDFEPLLKERPALSLALSNKLADRATRADRAFARYDSSKQTEQKKDLAQQFFDKMTGFFSFLKGSVTFK